MNPLTTPENLDHYLQTWNLSQPNLIAQTATSYVYTVLSAGETVILKLLTAIGTEEQKGALALRYYDGLGAVRLLRADAGAHLLEYADGQDLIPMVKSGDDESATGIIADVLNQLHAARPYPPPDGLTPLKTWFRALFNIAEQHRQQGIESIYRRAAALAEKVLDNPGEERVLHGDIHHENIRHRAARGWLAFDPKGLYGDRAYDAANTLCNPMDMPGLVENEARLLKTVDILADKLEIDRARVLTFVYLYSCLSASWTIEDGEYDAHAARIAELAEPHLKRS